MKYKLTKEILTYEGRTLYRIKALKDFSDVKKGDKGGYIEKESNLSQNGHCWIYDDAMVYGNARISGNAYVADNAHVYDNAQVFSNAEVYGDAKVFRNAEVYGDAEVFGNARVYGYADVFGTANIRGNSVATRKVIDVNLTYNVTITDNHIQIGCKQLTFRQALKLNERWEDTLARIKEAKFIERDKDVIVALIKRQLKKE